MQNSNYNNLTKTYPDKTKFLLAKFKSQRQNSEIYSQLVSLVLSPSEMLGIVVLFLNLDNSFVKRISNT